jgi:hypothetical protein
MIQDVSDQLFERFTAAVRAQLETAEAPVAGTQGGPAAAVVSEPIEAVSFGAQLAGRTLARWARGPAFWLGVAALAAFVYWLLR